MLLLGMSPVSIVGVVDEKANWGWGCVQSSRLCRQYSETSSDLLTSKLNSPSRLRGRRDDVG